MPGATLTFSYIATGAAVTDSLLRIQDDLGAALVRYPEGPHSAARDPKLGDRPPRAAEPGRRPVL